MSRFRSLLCPAVFVFVAGIVTVAPELAAQVDGDSLAESRLELEVYGEILFQHYDFGPDRKSQPEGAAPDSRSIVDIPRVVFEIGYAFDSTFSIDAELEIEHAGTGSALELEYEEFGEYEQETEKGGEVILEKIFVTARLSELLSLRAGKMILPVGLTNHAHGPDDYFGAVRPEGEEQILPVTWNEIGLAAFGRLGPVDWHVMLVNGLDATGFTSERWIVEGHQKKFEVIRTTDPALLLRLDYTPVEGVSIGGVIYRGASTGNRPKPDITDVDGVVTIAAADLVVDHAPLLFRGSYIEGDLSDAGEISAKNNRISRNLAVPRTPVASGARSLGLEAGYDLLYHFGSRSRLYPFVRFEAFNSMARVEGVTFADPRFRREVITAGLNYFPIDQIVLKADFSHRRLGGGDFNSENTVSLAIGFSGDLLDLSI